MSAAWLGKNDLACEQLAKAEQLPGYGTHDLWPIETHAVLGLTPRRPTLRANSCFPRVEDDEQITRHGECLAAKEL